MSAPLSSLPSLSTTPSPRSPPLTSALSPILPPHPAPPPSRPHRSILAPHPSLLPTSGPVGDLWGVGGGVGGVGGGVGGFRWLKLGALFLGVGLWVVWGGWGAVGGWGGGVDGRGVRVLHEHDAKRTPGEAVSERLGLQSNKDYASIGFDEWLRGYFLDPGIDALPCDAPVDVSSVSSPAPVLFLSALHFLLIAVFLPCDRGSTPDPFFDIIRRQNVLREAKRKQKRGEEVGEEELAILTQEQEEDIGTWELVTRGLPAIFSVILTVCRWSIAFTAVSNSCTSSPMAQFRNIVGLFLGEGILAEILAVDVLFTGGISCSLFCQRICGCDINYGMKLFLLPSLVPYFSLLVLGLPFAVGGLFTMWILTPTLLLALLLSFLLFRLRPTLHSPPLCPCKKEPADKVTLQHYFRNRTLAFYPLLLGLFVVAFSQIPLAFVNWAVYKQDWTQAQTALFSMPTWRFFLTWVTPSARILDLGFIILARYGGYLRPLLTACTKHPPHVSTAITPSTTTTTPAITPPTSTKDIEMAHTRSQEPTKP